MPQSPAVTATALAAFLRGIERRAQVFALAQSGDEVAAAAAVEATVKAFSAQAGDCPIGAWPAQFWSLLVQQRELARGGGESPLLAALSPGPRAALLLRLVAGLDFAHGAQVLAVAEPTYRFALQRGLDQLHAAGYDMAALEALRESLRARVLAASARLAPVDADEPLGISAEAVADMGESEPPAAAPWRWPALLATSLLIALGLSFLPPVEAWLQRLLARPAVVAAKPEMSLDAVSGIVTHPDFQLLFAPAEEVLAQQLGFLGWLDAGSPAPGEAPLPKILAATPEVPAASASFDALPDGIRGILAPIASLWPQLDDVAQARLLDNARQWLALDAAQREALSSRIRQWDALPAAARAQRRAIFAPWYRLLPSERRAIADAASRFSTLPVEQQQASREQFVALPDDAREAWAQGPMLGRALQPLAPLFEFVPADERDALLAVVRALTPELRAALATRIATMPRAERERLRRKLIATPAEGWAAVIVGT